MKEGHTNTVIELIQRSLHVRLFCLGTLFTAQHFAVPCMAR
jgi:hypothetical protein